MPGTGKSHDVNASPVDAPPAIEGRRWPQAW